jgi:predicted dehydrogenase
MWPVEQAPHVLQLISSYINNSQPVKVFAQTAGKHYLTHKSPSPDNSTAAIWYKNGVRAHVNFGTASAPKVHESEHVHMHKRVAVYGSKGYIQWTMWNWERFTPEGGYESGKHDYGAEDVQAQAGLTEAVFDWIENEAKVHPTHLKQSLAEFNLLLGIYVSGLEHRVLDLPFDPPNKLLETLKNLPN